MRTIVFGLQIFLFCFMAIQNVEAKDFLHNTNNNEAIINKEDENMIFNANRKRKAIEKKLISHPNLILITSTCIRISLEIYINSMREDIKVAGESCGVSWSEEYVSEIISILFNVCNFTIPSLFHQSFKEKEIANLYVNALMKYEKDKNISETYEYFQKILNEFDINILGLFPVVVGLENENFTERLAKNEKLSEISARAISFTNDLVIAFCTKNPIMDGYTGEYAVQMAMDK